MNEVVKKQWTDALRSGEYKQTKHQLKDDTGYCCLGVLCDIYAKEHNIKWNDNNFLGSEINLMPDVKKWANLEGNEGEYSADGKQCLSIDNDSNNKTFLEIADIIDNNF